ncbi:anthranilate synthase component 1 [Actinopolyspora lacussalsi]|nr:anthranilate synthase component 1 [Actinopolyspora lacussalsi]
MTRYLEDTAIQTRDPECVPGPAEAAALAVDYPVIPLHREFLADTVTPVTLFAQLCGSDEPGFLLEGVPTSGESGRYSYIGYRPKLLEIDSEDPLTTVWELIDRSIAPVPGLPPFHGGVVGYLGYETARHFENLPVAEEPAPNLPESAFLLTDDLVVVDHATRKLLLVTLHRPNQESYTEAVRRIDLMQSGLRTTVLPGPEDGPVPTTDPDSDPADLDEWRSNFSREEYERRVRRAREYIAAGDAFQIVLSQRFSKPLRADPIDVYRQLRATNPSPYLYHVSLGNGRHIIGASPELLVKNEGGRVQTRPLAGTRRRDPDAKDDLVLENELLDDEKEKAEHVMLVDLGRNDLGRVSQTGSVRVDRLMEVERFSHVMHLSSTVSGRLTSDADALDALRATFPAGTLSGAPKIRAMEIISELERQRRGVYGGAIGCFSHGGNADLAIALRTLVVADGMVHVQAGAGVVVDSDPTAEYQETLHKARALFAAVRRAEAMS